MTSLSEKEPSQLLKMRGDIVSRAAEAGDRMLRRKDAARYLTERGFPVAPQTLARLAVVSGGPTFRKFGRFPLYRLNDLDLWADRKLGPAQSSTSDTKERA